MMHRQQVYYRYHYFHRLFWQQSEARCPFVQYAKEAFRQKKTPHTSSRQTKPEESTVETVSAHELGCAIPCSPQCFIPLFSPLQLSVCGLIISQHTGELTQTTHLPHCGCIRLLPSSFVRPSLSYSRQSYLLSLPMIHTIKCADLLAWNEPFMSWLQYSSQPQVVYWAAQSQIIQAQAGYSAFSKSILDYWL